MPAIETVRSVVHAWECDENNHLNASFYAKNFTKASLYLLKAAGVPTLESISPRKLYFRFHSEAALGQCFFIKSAFLKNALEMNGIAHLMLNVNSGAVIASALDFGRYSSSNSSSYLSSAYCEDHKDFGPALNKLNLFPDTQTIISQRLIEEGSLVTARTMLSHSEACDAAHVLLFTEGAAQIWEQIGLTKEVMRENHWGKVVIDLSISIFRPFQVNDLVEQHSSAAQINRRMVMMRHYQFNPGTDHLFAMAEATGMIMHSHTRKSISIPSFIANKVQSLCRSNKP